MGIAGTNAGAQTASEATAPLRSIGAAPDGTRKSQIVVRRLEPFVGPLIGVDVGEDFLDLAVLDGAAKTLRLARVAVAGVERAVGARNLAVKDYIAGDGAARTPIAGVHAAITGLRRRLLAAAPELGAADATVMVDSPRWPRDLDLARRAAERAGAPGVVIRAAPGRIVADRAIDSALRAIVDGLALKNRDGSPLRLALYPTPKFAFFAACARDPACKPHLAAFARELFGPALDRAPALPRPAGGRFFTRFMFAGFAAYRALEPSAGALFEAYPDLAFRLWAGKLKLPPKRERRAALATRRRILRRLAGELGCAGVAKVSTLDEADAAILAIGAAQASRAGLIAVVGHPAEGRFVVAGDERLAFALDRLQVPTQAPFEDG